MKKLALREVSGDWIYYVTALKYHEVADYVCRIDNELHTSRSLSEMIQRSLTNNVDKIANYIKNQEEHFFNALVLAVYDGDPQWREIELDYGDGETYELGILEFTGNEKIFPVDGQHRVEGIKQVLQSSDAFADETVSVIFIGHQNTPTGRQRTRRLFSTLNRYAKPVTLNDIIALDEDDIVAIATRYLIESHPLFNESRLNYHKQKAIPESDKTAFTNIISLYECNTALLSYFIKDITVLGNNEKVLRGKRKIDAYCRFRPSDEITNNFNSFVSEFWNSFATNINSVREYLSIETTANPALPFRNKTGGNLLFRPIGQRPFVIAAISLYEKLQDFDKVMTKMNLINYKIQGELWQKIAWNPFTNKMIASSNGKLIEYVLKYLLDPLLLSEKEQIEMVNSYKAYKEDDALDVIDFLENYRIPLE